MNINISLLRQAFVSQRQFYDDYNFPRGFSRSGNFTLLEASILEQHGVVLQGLYNKTLEPQNEIQEQFISVTAGSQEPTNPIERAWIKYLKLTTSKTKFHTLFGRSKMSAPTLPSSDYYSESDSI
ncbi:hypothetical protein AMS58_19550 [Pseudoalteromonas porphyrae]|uniref:Macrodomain Ori protein n=2 Tax=Pseudoalteromonas TaxID=53246 RepID=A0A0N1EET6_9GAMM|nr:MULTISPECIES: DUF413 domain-containing protein [Pseudoalteromonas]KPH56866.1 hypothetical protein ADS77_19800 [Pseudoalteromonas porphyrae]KPH93026.1 hypothetical protein AMS58_19550 [Pseudoalteromonas porphyrae]NMR27577.1 DUF413 domain-containing protein [Pseudoalteromonas sp. NEC-BIFX-2020_015]NNG44252.1 DUF413 domain-containing protein [Pseudoalteromonas sp. NEC-BIFX-2020_002]